jgi:hypothetical protein
MGARVRNLKKHVTRCYVLVSLSGYAVVVGAERRRRSRRSNRLPVGVEGEGLASEERATAAALHTPPTTRRAR